MPCEQAAFGSGGSLRRGARRAEALDEHHALAAEAGELLTGLSGK